MSDEVEHFKQKPANQIQACQLSKQYRANAMLANSVPCVTTQTHRIAASTGLASNAESGKRSINPGTQRQDLSRPASVDNGRASTATLQQKTVLLTLGRLPVGLEIARSFAHSGWRVVVAEPFGMHLCRMSRSVSRSYTTRAPCDGKIAYLDDLRRIIDAESVTLVVPVSEETMHVAALAAQLPGIEVFTASHSQVLNLHDKLTFNQQASGYGLPVPLSFGADDANLAKLIDAHPVVVKPRLGSSGRGVRFINKGTSTDDALARSESERAGDRNTAAELIVQQRIDGDEYSSFSIARSGHVMATIIYRARATAGSVAVVFEHLSNNAPHSEAMISWVAEFVEHSKHEGFISFDFIVDSNGIPHAIECNPRATSGIHFITAESLAQTIFQAEPEPVGLKKNKLMQESYSSFTALLGSLTKASDRSKRLKLLTRARDVSWSKSDPWPFLLMMINTAPLITRAAINRLSFASAAVLDIEWARDRM